MNLVPATLTDASGALETPLGRFAAPRPVRTGRAGEAALVGVRPSDLRIAGAAEGGLATTVRLVEPLGDVTVVSVEAGGETLRLVLPEAAALGMRPGDALPIAIDPGKFHIFRAADGLAMA